jgi:hypothetical protein
MLGAFMKRRLVLEFCCVLAGVILFVPRSKAADPEAACRAVTDRFMQVWCAAPTNGVFKELLKDVWYKPDEVDQIAKQTETQQTRAQAAARDEGKPAAVPFEYLGSRQMGENHVKVIYLEKLERTMIPWSFLFYRPADSWRLVGILKGEGAKDDLMAMGAEDGPDADIPRQLADAFMKDLSAGQEEAAFTALVEKRWARPEESADVKQRIAGLYRSRRALGQLTLGKPIAGGYERLTTRSIGKSLVKMVYLQKFEFGVLPFKAVFYCPEKEWTLYELTFGEGVTKDDLASATKVHPAK